jgi:hypothetical protein
LGYSYGCDGYFSHPTTEKICNNKKAKADEINSKGDQDVIET